MVDWRLTREIFIYVVYLTGRVFFTLGITCWRLINGTHHRIQQRRKAKNYHWSAHVQDVVYRRKFDIACEPSSTRNFFLVHNRFDHPRTVLRDSVTLYNLTDTEAIFVETDESVDVTLLGTSGFVVIGQFLHAKRVIEIPLESFHRLAKEVGDPPGEVVLISNTTRCGSTLLTQFFEETGHCLCYSEPDAINCLSVLIGVVPDAVLEQRLLSCLRLLFKPRSGKTYEANVIKFRGTTMTIAEPLTRAYPRIRHIFSYREGRAVMRSLFRLSEGMLLFKMSIASANISQELARFIFPLMRAPFTDHAWYEPGSFNVKCALLWAGCCSNYTNFRRRGMDIAAVRYEDFLADPLKAGRAILRFLDLPEEWAVKGIRALDKDSQRKSPVNRDAMGRVSVPELTAEDVLWIEEMCRRLKVPSFTEKCVLENTISG